MFKGIFCHFFNNFKWYRILRENLVKNLENFRNLHLYGFGGGAPEASEFIKNLVENLLETCNF